MLKITKPGGCLMTFDFEPYCSKCRDIEPIAKVLDMLSFCDDSDVEIIISCKNSDRCRAIAEYLKNQK